MKKNPVAGVALPLFIGCLRLQTYRDTGNRFLCAGWRAVHGSNESIGPIQSRFGESLDTYWIDVTGVAGGTL